MFPTKFSLKEFRRRIQNTDDFELVAIISAIRQRYRMLHPESEILFLSVPTNDPVERTAIRQWLLEHFV